MQKNLLQYIHRETNAASTKVKANMKEIIIYGLPQGETRGYMEDILANFASNANDAANIEKVKAAASAQGWHSFRVATYNGEAPNFAKAVNV